MVNDARPKVALVWLGERDARGASPALETTRLRGVAAALSEAGLRPIPVAYGDAVAETVRGELLAVDGVLVWVNPVERGAGRARLDALLREVAAAGVWVSAHPDTID